MPENIGWISCVQVSRSVMNDNTKMVGVHMRFYPFNFTSLPKVSRATKNLLWF